MTGRLEDFGDDMPYVVTRLYNLSPDQFLTHANQNIKTPPGDRLRQFEFIDCDQTTYLFDWSGDWEKTIEPGGNQTTSEVNALGQTPR